MNFSTFNWYIENLSWMKPYLKSDSKKDLEKIQAQLYELVDIARSNYIQETIEMSVKQ